MTQYKRIIMWLHNEFGDGNDNVKLVVDALEKQIPKKPINEDGYYANNRCPMCKHRIKSGEGSSSRERTNWCNHCGQAIDWSDEE